jgi:hypothetical protein
MEKLRFRKSEVIAYVEDLIHSNMATEDELNWYENFIWNNKFNKNYTYKLVISKMRQEYNGF